LSNPNRLSFGKRSKRTEGFWKQAKDDRQESENPNDVHVSLPPEKFLSASPEKP